VAESTLATGWRLGVVLFVTDGRAVEYAPELYFDRAGAAQEADRWAWFLGEYGEWPIRWAAIDVRIVGIHEIRLVQVRCPPADELWCGIDLERSPRLAAGGSLYESRIAAVTGIRGDHPTADFSKELTDFRLESSHVSIHRLKTTCPSRTLSALSRRGLLRWRSMLARPRPFGPPQPPS
jgi:hypothetical protein